MTFSANYSSGTTSTGTYGGGSFYVHTPVVTEPFLGGSGPASCSTSTALSVRPAYIFDVNGYYRALRVRPDATRKQLRLAYFDCAGDQSERLTYILKQLLNPVVRADYDSAPFGSRYIDKYVEEEIRKRAMAAHAARMAERMAEGLIVNDDVEKESLRNVFGDMGFPVEFDDDTPAGVLDETPSVPEDEPRPAKFSYAYYLWRTRIRSVADLTTLGRWQELLIRAFSQRGLRTEISVGLYAGMAPAWAVARIGYRTVFFLNHDADPTAELAQKAADEHIKSNTPTPS